MKITIADITLTKEQTCWNMPFVDAGPRKDTIEELFANYEGYKAFNVNANKKTDNGFLQIGYIFNIS